MSWSTNRIYDDSGRIVLSVEQKHLDFAVKRSSACCAIATAIRDAVPDARRISVDVMWIKFTRNGKRLRVQTPAAGRECIMALDSGNVSAVQPFVLRLKPEFQKPRSRPGESRRGRHMRKPKGEPRATTVTVTAERQHGLRIYRRTQAQAPTRPGPPPRPVRPPEMTKSELRRELAEAVRNTAALQPSC